MNRIVREHYPAERLPDELREGLDPGARVTVTVEQAAESIPGPPMRFAERSASIYELRALAQEDGPTTDDPVARIRALRDEWDD